MDKNVLILDGSKKFWIGSKQFRKLKSKSSKCSLKYSGPKNAYDYDSGPGST